MDVLAVYMLRRALLQKCCGGVGQSWAEQAEVGQRWLWPAAAGQGWAEKAQVGQRWLWPPAAGQGWPEQPRVGQRWLWPAAAGQGWVEQAQVGQCWLWPAAAGQDWPEQPQVGQRWLRPAAAGQSLGQAGRSWSTLALASRGWPRLRRSKTETGHKSVQLWCFHFFCFFRFLFSCCIFLASARKSVQLWCFRIFLFFRVASSGVGAQFRATLVSSYFLFFFVVPLLGRVKGCSIKPAPEAPHD